MSDKPKSVLREVSPEVVAEVRHLIAGARHGALATVSHEDGHPVATRVGIATLADGTPIILVSGLSAHTPALLADPRCSLLIGEPGKGDPLAHPRITIKCEAQRLERDSPAHNQARAAYLAAHPKASLYVDLGDFRFFALKPLSASYNGGFGRAYALDGGEIAG